MTKPNDYNSPMALALLDLEYGDRTIDIPFYVDRALKSGGPILELGCGAGRITLPIARAGVEITGVDSSGPLLAELAKKLDGALPMNVVKGDPTERVFWGSGGRVAYKAVFAPFNLLTHFTDHAQILRLLGGAREALQRGGTFVFDVSLPSPGLYYETTEEDMHGFRIVRDDAEATWATWEEGTYDPISGLRRVSYKYLRGVDRPAGVRADWGSREDRWPPGIDPGERMQSLDLRLQLRTVTEWDVLLDWAGLVRLESWGGFAGEKLAPGCHRLVAVCGRKS